MFAAQLQSVVADQLNKFAPLRKVRKRGSSNTARWLSPDAIAAKRERRRLERTWKQSHTESDRVAYRRACRRANTLINKSRGDFFRRKLSECTDSRQRWSTVKRLLHSAPTDKQFVSVDSDMCDKLANFFVSKIANLRHSISARLSAISPLSLPVEPTHSGPSLESLTPVTPLEVYNILSSIKPKSSALDFVPTSLLKACPTVFSEIISNLANLSFQEGCFPQMFKTAVVTPLIKKPNLDPTNFANFRPISNLNNISKILERLFLARILPHVLSSANFNPLQSAYRRNHSTETALLHTFDHIFHSADSGKCTLLVSLDLSAAFDTIDHSVLITRLQSTFGISGHALNWVNSYLSNRKQFVKIENVSSSTVACSSGVPQGSVLGPLLFTLYVSPIASLLSLIGVNQHQYADDTQLYIEISNSTLSSDTSRLESGLSLLSYWFSLNWLALNPEKSEAILFGTRQRSRSLVGVDSINVAGSTVHLTDHIKLLGITLDNNLSLHRHINLVSQSCYHHIRAFRHIRHVLDKDTATLVAHSLVSSRLDYANSLLIGSPSSNIAKLQHIQHTLARIVLLTNRQTHSNNLLQQLHWLPVRSRIHFKLATITYKALSISAPLYLHSLLQHYHPARSLRSSNQQLITVPPSRTVFGSRSFRCTAPSIWNSLPLHIRSSPSLSTFKRSLKTYLFSNPPA